MSDEIKKRNLVRHSSKLKAWLSNRVAMKNHKESYNSASGYKRFLAFKKQFELKKH